MAVILQMTYMKKLGLPNFSSHSCAVSLTVEISDASQAAQESSKLYSLLQTAVDHEIEHVGYMPDASTYGMKPSQNGGEHPSNPSGQGNGHPGNYGNGQQPQQLQNGDGESWNCTDGQKSFLNRIVHDNSLNKDDVERMSYDLFGVGVKKCNKMQMSQLIDDLLERNGGKSNGRRRWSPRQPARQ